MDNTVKQAGDMREAGGTNIPQGERTKTGTDNVRILGGELVMLLKEGVRTGDADRDFPEEIARLVEMGTGAGELMDALRQAAQRARISPLMFARAEKLLDMGLSEDEPADRSRVLSRSRNQLTL